MVFLETSTKRNENKHVFLSVTSAKSLVIPWIDILETDHASKKLKAIFSNIFQSSLTQYRQGLQQFWPFFLSINPNIMKDKTTKKLVSWDDHMDKKYGKMGSPTRDKYEEEFETFKIGVLIQEARKQKHLTQEELAL